MLVTFAASLIVLLGMGALALDLSMAYLARKHLQNLADLSALAAVKVYGKGQKNDPELLNKMTQAATSLASNNAKWAPGGSGSTQALNPNDVIPIVYDLNTHTITLKPANVNADPVNAVEVTLRMDGTLLPAFSFFLGKIFGQDTMTLQAQAIASFTKKHVAIVLDNSNSMQYGSYKHLSQCPAAAFPWNVQDHRYFLYSARSAADVPNCLATPNILPQPISDVFASTRDVLLQNANLFGTFYRAGLVVYGTSASTIVALTQDDNKVEVQNVLTAALQDWQNYALSNLADPFDPPPNPMSMTPGGTDPVTTGYTGTGGAIALARNLLLTASQTDNVSDRQIVLFSDGVPNCDSAGYCSSTAAAETGGKAYAKQEAANAAQDEIVIHTIYFDPSAATCTSQPGYIHLRDDVAVPTGGRAYCAKTITDLNNAFNDLPASIALAE